MDLGLRAKSRCENLHSLAINKHAHVFANAILFVDEAKLYPGKLPVEITQGIINGAPFRRKAGWALASQTDILTAAIPACALASGDHYASTGAHVLSIHCSTWAAVFSHPGSPISQWLAFSTSR